jgi:hypothetical protein
VLGRRTNGATAPMITAAVADASARLNAYGKPNSRCDEPAPCECSAINPSAYTMTVTSQGEALPARTRLQLLTTAVGPDHRCHRPTARQLPEADRPCQATVVTGEVDQSRPRRVRPL